MHNYNYNEGIGALSVGIQTLTGFQKMGIKTIKDLTDKTSSDLLKQYGFGYKCLDQTSIALEELGLELADGYHPFKNSEELQNIIMRKVNKGISINALRLSLAGTPKLELVRVIVNLMNHSQDSKPTSST